MKVLFLTLLSAVVHLSSSQWFTGRHPLGIEPYIPYHHICIRSCLDSFAERIDLRIKWSCCDRGWNRCCASSMIQIPALESLFNPYQTPHPFDSSIQSNLNPLQIGFYPTHSDQSTSHLGYNPFKIVDNRNPFPYGFNPVFQQNPENSDLNQFSHQENENLRINNNFKRRIVNHSYLDRSDPNVTETSDDFSSYSNSTESNSTEFPSNNVTISSIDDQISSNQTSV